MSGGVSDKTSQYRIVISANVTRLVYRISTPDSGAAMVARVAWKISRKLDLTSLLLHRAKKLSASIYKYFVEEQFVYHTG